MKNTKLILGLILIVFFTNVSVNAQDFQGVTSYETPVVRRLSDYFDDEVQKRIEKSLVSGEIPVSLPKYVSGTKEEYVKVLREWAANHLELIKSEYHEKILGRAVKNKQKNKNECNKKDQH